jgi:phenylacetate-CoA ligase
MFWQKDIETISRRALEELQLKRLKQTVRQAYKNIPFYKDHCRSCIKPKISPR